MSYKSIHTGAQVDEAVSKVLNSEVSGGVTILLPNDSTFASDVASEEFLAYNRETYAKLYAQADKELSVSMRYFGRNILCNPTMRVRFVDDGVNPYYDYCYIVLHGNLIETGQTYRLFSDGKVAKVKFNGDIIIDANGKLKEDITTEILYGEELFSPVGSIILNRSNYTQSRESSSAALGTKWQPFIAMTGTELRVGNLFGSNNNDEFSLSQAASWDKETNIVTVLGGWTHPLFGTIDSDIQFNFDPITQTLTTVEETITLAGWATITGYKLTRTTPLVINEREDNLTEYLDKKASKEEVANIDPIALEFQSYVKAGGEIAKTVDEYKQIKLIDIDRPIYYGGNIEGPTLDMLLDWRMVFSVSQFRHIQLGLLDASAEINGESWGSFTVTHGHWTQDNIDISASDLSSDDIASLVGGSGMLLSFDTYDWYLFNNGEMLVVTK